MRDSSSNLLADMNLYGPLLVQTEALTLDNQTMPILHVNALTYLAGLYHAGGSFSKCLDYMHAKCPSSMAQPWRAVLYTDEVHPGHQLSSSSKKLWTIYLSFLEYGCELSHEASWLTLFVCRSSKVRELQGGIGQCFRIILEHMFGGCPFGHPLHGLYLKGANGTTLKLFFTLSMFLQDGAAQKSTFANRQDAGSRMCMMCKNIFTAKGKQPEEGSDEESIASLADFVKYKDLALTSDNEIVQKLAKDEGQGRTCFQG